MASSPADSGGGATANTAFLLQELIACWDQAYEALCRGELDPIAALLDHTDDLLARLPDHRGDGPAETALRERAAAARGRLEHGMQAGLDGLRDELARARQGAKTLGGYRAATGMEPGRVIRTA